jgi:UDP-glucose 4-epimerase
MKILVTGGAGFIGSHVVDLYVEQGHQVTVIDNLQTGKKENVNNKAIFYNLDICSDAKRLESIIQAENFDIINHHAAQKSVPKSVLDPIHDANTNIIGTLKLLELSVKHQIKKFIFISSGGALVGESGSLPFKEEDEISLLSPYAISKFIVEKYLEYYWKTYQLPYTVLRYGNVYGPRQIPDGECGVTSIFIQNLLSNRTSALYAYPTMPEGATRDYVYVEDVAAANLVALNKGYNQIFNIGTTTETSTKALYKMIQQAMGTNIDLIQKPERKGDIKRSQLDCTKAEKVLNWKAKTSLEDGLKKTVDWEQTKKS